MQSKKEHVHAEGLIEVCTLPEFRGTPHEIKALRSALSVLTQVKRTPDGTPIAQVIKGTLFVKLNLGDVSPAALPGIASYAIGRVQQKAHQALTQQRLSLVKVRR